MVNILFNNLKLFMKSENKVQRVTVFPWLFPNFVHKNIFLLAFPNSLWLFSKRNHFPGFFRSVWTLQIFLGRFLDISTMSKILELFPMRYLILQYKILKKLIIFWIICNKNGKTYFLISYFYKYFLIRYLTIS